MLEVLDVAHTECDHSPRSARDVEVLQDQRINRNMFMAAFKTFDETEPAVDSLIQPPQDEQPDYDGTLDV